MKIETIEFSFNATKERGLSLTELQIQYFDVFKKERSIKKAVQFFLNNGWLVNFSQLYDLVKTLDAKDILIPKISLAKNSIARHTNKITFSDFCKWPFFRSLPEPIQNYLWDMHQIVNVAAGTTIVIEGENTKDLWTQVTGQSAIYTKGLGHLKKVVGVIDPMSTFGELGFFMGEARSADIVTLCASSFIKIPYSKDIQQLVKKDAFQNLKHRFQVMRAFMQSTLFKNLPEHTMDEVIFRGRLLNAKPQQLLFNEGDVGAACYIIISGQVGIFQQGTFINLLKQGSCLGEVSLFWSGGKRTAAAVAQSECLLLEIKQSDFYAVLSENIQLAVELEALAFERGQNDLQRKKVA